MTFGTNENGSHIWERCSVASSTSTASNLPGPGRALDNLYGSVGRTIEAHLGRLAEKLGRGPRMAAVRIERRRSKVLNFAGDGRKARTKTKKVVKDCKKLVGYVQWVPFPYHREAFTKVDPKIEYTLYSDASTRTNNSSLCSGPFCSRYLLRYWRSAYGKSDPELLLGCLHARLVASLSKSTAFFDGNGSEHHRARNKDGD